MKRSKDISSIDVAKRSAITPNKCFFLPATDKNILLKSLKEHVYSGNTPKQEAVLEKHVNTFLAMLHRSNYPNVESVDPSEESQKEWRSVPPKMLRHIQDNFRTTTSKIHQESTSGSGQTTKLLVELQDGHMVESVIMRHDLTSTSKKEKGRITLCVSSQVGCRMGCTFCATGTMGIIGDLLEGEILEQLVHANRVLRKGFFESLEGGGELSLKEGKTEIDRSGRERFVPERILRQRLEQKIDRVRNIVFMGMGEPLNNYDNVSGAVRGMITAGRFGLGQGHVTVSTVGVTPMIKKLTSEMPFVNLALSLHAPNQEMRSKIVPAAKAYKIEGLIEALDCHINYAVGGSDEKKEGGGKVSAKERKQKERKAMIQYTMLNGDTSTFQCAHQLGALCRGKSIIVNLIPYNQTDVKDCFSAPSMDHIKKFQEIVMSYGLLVFIRKTMGEDIAGACGQLVLQKQNDGESNTNVDIEDVVGGDSGGASPKKPRIVVRRKEERVVSESQNDGKEFLNGTFNSWLLVPAFGAAIGILLIGAGVTKKMKR